jgi:hypothetical protein
VLFRLGEFVREALEAAPASISINEGGDTLFEHRAAE